jgi:nucleotide-binding universal stress UspA family protein
MKTHADITNGGRAAAAAGPLFRSIVVGVDRSPESTEAVRQAAVLLDRGGTLTILAGWNLAQPILGGPGVLAPAVETDSIYREEAETAVLMALAPIAGAVQTRTVVACGTAWSKLLEEADHLDADLVAVGTHGMRRLPGILLGSTATEVVHRANRSVLVARPAPGGFPRRVVVGIDGSAESAAAYAVGRGLVERHEGELWPVVAHGGKGVDKQQVASIVDGWHEDLLDVPVDALVAASADADIVVVGSRGLHGVKALGSVSERVAHRARSSVLIVRS